jgi:hypothetical protein
MNDPMDTEEQKEFLKEMAQNSIEASYKEVNLKKLRPMVYFYVALAVIACGTIVYNSIRNALDDDYTLLYAMLGAFMFLALVLIFYLIAYISYRRHHGRRDAGNMEKTRSVETGVSSEL